MDVEANALNIAEVRAMREESKIDNQTFQHLEVIKWLNPADSENHFENIYRATEVGTGDWLLHTDKLQAWLNGEQSYLWVNGIPGYCSPLLFVIKIP